MDKSWNEALRLMRAALEILDNCDGPPDVGAHLDLAIARLESHVDGLTAEGVVEPRIKSPTVRSE
jgi:hypothetical protein